MLDRQSSFPVIGEDKDLRNPAQPAADLLQGWELNT
jgi:hypothetical protein